MLQVSQTACRSAVRYPKPEKQRKKSQASGKVLSKAELDEYRNLYSQSHDFPLTIQSLTG
jgi:hypothetical protein